MMSYNTIVVLFFLFSISYTGATYANNHALSFDGVNDIVKIGHMNTDLLLADFWTAEAWVKLYGNQANNFQPNIVGFPSRHPQLEFCGTTTHTGCVGHPTRTLAQLRTLQGAYFTMVGDVDQDFTKNQWFHIAATWNNKTFATYINGNLDTSMEPYSQGYTEPLNCSNVLCDEGIDIGGYRFITAAGTIYDRQYFTGLIDEVRVWKVGRSQEDIKNTMNTVLSGGEDGLLYYYRFDEGTGLLVTSTAFPSYGTLGGGIPSTLPTWVLSDSPLTNPYPAPTPNGGGGGITCNTNEPGLYATAAILSILFIIAGIVIGIVGYRKFQSREYKQLQ